MQASTRGVNTILALIAAFLAAAALTAMYLNRNQPVIREGLATPAPETGQLPEGHPPVDQGAKVVQAEQDAAKDPRSAELQAKLGNAYYDAAQYDKAITAYEQSLRLKPQEPSVETDMATCYHFRGEHDKALGILERVLGYRPGFPQALFNKGVILQLGKSDNKSAVAAWEELLRLNPAFAQRAELEERIRQLKSAGK